MNVSGIRNRAVVFTLAVALSIGVGMLFWDFGTFNNLDEDVSRMVSQKVTRRQVEQWGSERALHLGDVQPVSTPAYVAKGTNVSAILSGRVFRSGLIGYDEAYVYFAFDDHGILAGAKVVYTAK